VGSDIGRVMRLLCLIEQRTSALPRVLLADAASFRARCAAPPAQVPLAPLPGPASLVMTFRWRTGRTRERGSRVTRGGVRSARERRAPARQGAPVGGPFWRAPPSGPASPA